MPSKTILVPIDFSPGSRRALVEAFQYHRSSRILLLHVVSTPVAANKAREITQSIRMQLKRFCEVNSNLAARISYHARHGVPFQEILRFAQQEKVDLIILARDDKGTRVSANGYTADRVGRYARCAVMLVPADEAKREQLPA